MMVPASHHPALAYWCWIRTLWQIDQAHDFHGRPRAANDISTGMEAGAGSPAGLTLLPGRQGAPCPETAHNSSSGLTDRLGSAASVRPFNHGGSNA